MQPMTKEEAERFLKWNPKPWSDDYSAHCTTPCIVSNDKVRIRRKELLRYIAYLEQRVCHQRGELEESQRVHSALVESYNKLKREHEPDFYCEYCSGGMLETDREFVDQLDSVHCSQDCVDKAEAQW